MSAATPGQAAGWWVCDGPLPAGGRKITGPFATQELALTVRAYVEKAEGRTDLWVDDEPGARGPASGTLALVLMILRDGTQSHASAVRRAVAAIERSGVAT